jgi:hypothetical protein
MRKFTKDILSIALALLFIAVAIFPVAASSESESETSHNHDETCLTEASASDLIGLDGAQVNNLTCLIKGHLWSQISTYVGSGFFEFGPDDIYCYTLRQRIIPILKCSRCGTLGEGTPYPGAIIDYVRHYLLQSGQPYYSSDGKYICIPYECARCGHTVIDLHPIN